MFTVNPFVELSGLISPLAMQIFVIVMVILTVGGTILDMIHKKNAQYFFENAKELKKSATRHVPTGEKISIIVKTLAHDVATSAARRIKPLKSDNEIHREIWLHVVVRLRPAGGWQHLLGHDRVRLVQRVGVAAVRKGIGRIGGRRGDVRGVGRYGAKRMRVVRHLRLGQRDRLNAAALPQTPGGQPGPATRMHRRAAFQVRQGRCRSAIAAVGRARQRNQRLAWTSSSSSGASVVL